MARTRMTIEEKIERQKNILEKYERAYLEYIGGSKR